LIVLLGDVERLHAEFERSIRGGGIPYLYAYRGVTPVPYPQSADHFGLILRSMKIIVVEDDPLIKAALHTGLASLGIEVAASTISGPEALSLTLLHRPDVVLLDLDLGDGPTGVDIAVGIRRRLDSVGLVILSSYASPRLVGRSLPDLPKGTIFLQKKNISDLKVLANALTKAYENSDAHPRKMLSTKEVAEPIDLTDLEIQLMKFISMGLTNAEIAKRRFITEKSTENAIRLLSRKVELDYDADIHNQRIMIARKYLSLIGKI
jgi:DNA-binding NarL/FixJ family response regulator